LPAFRTLFSGYAVQRCKNRIAELVTTTARLWTVEGFKTTVLCVSELPGRHQAIHNEVGLLAFNIENGKNGKKVKLKADNKTRGRTWPLCRAQIKARGIYPAVIYGAKDKRSPCNLPRGINAMMSHAAAKTF